MVKFVTVRAMLVVGLHSCIDDWFKVSVTFSPISIAPTCLIEFAVLRLVSISRRLMEISL